MHMLIVVCCYGVLAHVKVVVMEGRMGKHDCIITFISHCQSVVRACAGLALSAELQGMWISDWIESTGICMLLQSAICLI
jgi:hypothetical protein